MEVGKRRLAGATAGATYTDKLKDLHRESRNLKEVVAEQTKDTLNGLLPSQTTRHIM